jgi:hypothetical protein
MKDMPKLESPFVRVDKIIKGKKRRIVINKINEGYEWVFDGSDVLCTEKLDGTNVSINMVYGELKGLANRTNRIFYDTLEDNKYINGVRVANGKGRISEDNGQHFGELMGPKIQKNFLKLDKPEWFPFEYLRNNFSYKSFHRYPKTFENLSNWFKNDIFSLLYLKLYREKVKPEGVVFYQPSTGKMSKLRCDMFEWYY